MLPCSTSESMNSPGFLRWNVTLLHIDTTEHSATQLVRSSTTTIKYLLQHYKSKGVDTVGALGAEAPPPPPRFSTLHYILLGTIVDLY